MLTHAQNGLYATKREQFTSGLDEGKAQHKQRKVENS